MAQVEAWGANPHNPEKKGKKHMAKKKRTAAQKAATKKMIAANKHGGKKHKGNPHKGSKKHHKKHRRSNPFGKLASGKIGDMAMHGAAAGVGALAVLAVNQAIVPMSFRDGGIKEAAVKGALGLGLGVLANSFSATKKWAPALATGGIVVAIEQALSGPVLSAGPKNLLGEAYYLGELDVRKLTALGTTPAAAKPRLLGELDKRSAVQGGNARANQNRMAIAGSASAMEPQ